MGKGRRVMEATCSEKRASADGIKKSFKAIRGLLIFTIGVVIAGTIVTAYKFLKNNKKDDSTLPVYSAVTELENTYNGYNVLGKIKIEKIGVDQYILDTKEDNALNSGVIKLYGNNLNENGNFCIAGHNFENVFLRLNELSVNDEITIVNKELEETKYIITEIFSVEPDDLSCLIQNKEKTEITLITCNNMSTTRLVVKAEKKI